MKLFSKTMENIAEPLHFSVNVHELVCTNKPYLSENLLIN